MPLHEILVKESLAQGFFVAAGVDTDAAQVEYQNHFFRFRNWIASKFHSDMKWLERGLERRSDVQKVFAPTQSVFCVGYRYSSQVLGTADLSKGVQYARYIRGADYHEEIKEKLEAVMAKIVSLSEYSDLEFKVCVDTSAVLERTWAALAGLGWIGKNTLLIHPQEGSFFLIGLVLLSKKLNQGVRLLPNYCGNCTACLDQCPTSAFVEPGVLDSNRCMSAWTLETRGPQNISDAELSKLGNRIAGCDICQEVCPFNLKVIKRETQSTGASGLKYAWSELQTQSETDYREMVKNSALSRVKPEDFKRNLAWVDRNRIR